MHKNISDTTATYALGIATERKLLRVPAGPQAGRRVAVVLTAAGGLKLAWSDTPRAAWSTPITVASDAADQPFDAVMDSNGNIHIAYTETSTGYLVTRKLTLSDGTWLVGDKVTVFNGGQARYPSLAMEKQGRLWVAWTNVNGSAHRALVKSSLNSGSSWGTGSSDSGDVLTEEASSAFAKLVVGPAVLHAICTSGGNIIEHRLKPPAGNEWSSAFTIASGEGFDHHFDAGVAADGLLGVVFNNSGLKYREYDGYAWGAVVSLDSNGGECPQLTFNGSVPVVVYLCPQDDHEARLKYTTRQDSRFSAPAALDKRAKPFDKILLFSAVQASYADVTSAGAASDTADVYHPATGVMVKDESDLIYVGMAEPFRFLRLRLSTSGSGGNVAYGYWEGANWRTFTPLDGCFALDESDRDLRLWENYDDIPRDWQKSYIEGELRFWLRLRVSAPFTVGPVGSQLTAISDLQAVSVGR
jgi:hypothetical protein